jgi:hypothetical protein
MSIQHILSKAISNRRFEQLNCCQVTIFDEQDGKIIKGVVVERNLFSFTVKSNDGNLRKFDISMLPMD